MTDTPAPRRRITQRLGFQIAFLLAVILLPLAVISGVQSMAVLHESRARAESGLLGETMRASAAGLRIVQEASGMATALALAVEPLLGDSAACSTLFARLVSLKTPISFAAFNPLDGQISCSSAATPINVAEDPAFRKAVEVDSPQIIVNRAPRFSGQPVFVLTAPVITAQETRIGFVSISVPLAMIDPLRQAADKVDLITFAADGKVVTAPSGIMDPAADLLPADRSLSALAGPDPLAFTALDATGRERIYAVVPLVAGEIYALGSRRASPGAGGGRGWVSGMPILLPTLMWLASLAVALFASNQLVVRYVARLSSAIRAFAGGSRVVQEIDVAAAPLEIREIATAFQRMTENVIRDEAELEDTIHSREVLLRELHHRVKNNLQLIASIMNMQLRRVADPALRDLLKGLQDRVLSLASVHRELFQTSGLADIHADELLSGIVAHFAARPDRHGDIRDIRKTFDPIRMTPDQAVSLALLTTEALNAAMRHAGRSDGNPGRIAICLRQDGTGQAVLEVVNPLGTRPGQRDAPQPMHGLGSQLVDGFAGQLGGTVERDETGGSHRLRVTFPLHALAEAEARRNGSQTG